MEQHALKNVNNCLNTNIYSYLETFCGQSYSLFQMLFIFSTPVLIRHLWNLKTVFPALVPSTCSSIARTELFANTHH